MKQGNSQSGNVLFLILIAVVLFGALIFAVTMSSRGQGGEEVNREHARLAASQLAQHSIDLERAVVKLRVGSGIADHAISFETIALPGYANPDCTNETCKIFAPSGGQASYIRPKREWLNQANAAQAHFGEWLFTGTTCIPGIGLGNDANCNADNNNLEIIAIVPWVTRSLCIEIDNRLGIPLDNGGPPKAAGSAWAAANPEFTGTFGGGETLIDAGNVLFGQAEGCFEGGGTPPAGSYHYYSVLYPR